MNRLLWLACCAALLLNSPVVSGQRRGGRGAGAGRGSAGGSAPDDLKDFKRALALQASPDQVARFKSVTASTEAALKSVREFIQIAESKKSTNLAHDVNPLNSAVEEAQLDNDQFLRSFSNAQKAGLKDMTKKLGKANSDLTKEQKTLAKELEHSAPDGNQVAGVTERLDKSLKDFQAQQLAIGNEMGIEQPAKSQ